MIKQIFKKEKFSKKKKETPKGLEKKYRCPYLFLMVDDSKRLTCGDPDIFTRCNVFKKENCSVYNERINQS